MLLAFGSAACEDTAADATGLILVHSVSGNIEPCGCGENVSGGWANLVGEARRLGLPLVSGGNFLEGGALDRVTASALRDHEGVEDFLVCLGPDEMISRDLLPDLGRPYLCASVRDESEDIAHTGTAGNARITSIVEPALAADASLDLVHPTVALGRLMKAMDDGNLAGVLFLYAKEATRDRLLHTIKKSRRPILVVDCLPTIEMPGRWVVGGGALVQCAPAARQFVVVGVEPAQATKCAVAPGQAAPGAWVFRTAIETTGSSSSAATRAMLDRHDARLKALVDEARGSTGFAGSEACRGCHADEYDVWSSTGHARAMETLRNAGKATQVRCYVCHITSTPLDRATSWLPPLPARRDLHCVGCESCHGPGERHVGSAVAADIGTPSPRTCTHCHTKKFRLAFSYETAIGRASCRRRRF